MKTHALKIYQEPFSAQLNGSKSFEFRRNNRLFELGDMVELWEWNPTSCEYTGRFIRGREIEYIAYGPSFEIPNGFCIFQLQSSPKEGCKN